MSFLYNHSQKFSSLMKIAHWSITVMVCLQYYFVYYSRAYFSQGSPERLQYILLHKSVGPLLFVMLCILLFARHLGQRPVWPNDMPFRERLLARTVHVSLYLTLFLMVVSGYMLSSYGGYPVSIFGWFELPVFVAKNPETAKMIYGYHDLLSKVLYILVGLHVLGALKHHFIDKNTILKRMLPLC